MPTLTPNMNLTLPPVALEPGPAWASEINSDITILDSHNHAPGSGVQINPAGININSDLTFNSNSAISLLSSVYVPQTSVATLAAIYVTTDGELTYNDNSGNIVPITKNGSVNAGSGSITGLVAPAAAFYGSSTFTWQSDSGAVIAANMDARNYILRNNTSNSKGLTLSPPTAMGADFTLTLPSLPASAAFVTLSNTGAMGTTLQSSAFVGAGNIQAGGVSAANQIANGIITTTQISPTAGITASQLASGVALAVQTTSFTAGQSGNWTVPAGVTQVWVTMYGGGGGGGSGACNASGGTMYGGGGGAGAVPLTYLMAVTPAASIAYVVSTGGNGGASIGATNPGNPGVAGGNTTFNGVIAYGGAGGGGGQFASGGSGAQPNSVPVCHTAGESGGAPNVALGGNGARSAYAAGGIGGSASNPTSGCGGGGGAGAGAGGNGGASFTGGSAGSAGAGGGGGAGAATGTSGAGGAGGGGLLTLVWLQ